MSLILSLLCEKEMHCSTIRVKFLAEEIHYVKFFRGALKVS